MPLELLIITPYPIHYQMPVFERLAETREIHVLFLRQARGASGYDWEFGKKVDFGIRKIGFGNSLALPTTRDEKSESQLSAEQLRRALAVIRAIVRLRPKAVYVHGFAGLPEVAALLTCRLTGIPTLLRSVSYDLGERSRLRSGLRKVLYPPILSLATRIGYIGWHNRAFFLNHGVKPHRLRYVPHGVDNASFDTDPEPDEELDMVARRKFTFVFVGKLIDKKAPDLLLRAFRAMPDRDTAMLAIVGSGAMKGDLQRYAEQEDLDVDFFDFLAQRQLAALLGRCDCLVLPSRYQETWGLVVNEALASGLPVIVSDRVGCAPDLVMGKTGYVFASDSVESLVQAMDSMRRQGPKSDYRDRTKMVVDSYSASAIAEALSSVVGELLVMEGSMA